MTTDPAIKLPFTLASLRKVLDMGISSDTVTHADIAEWADRFVSEYISEEEIAFEDKDLERAYEIVDDIDTQWEMNLINKYPVEEIATKDVSNVKLPKELFVKWAEKAK
ncbi:MAG TPA: hypothetical protein VGE18_02405 [Candidatus Paceibacterota bacterium]